MNNSAENKTLTTPTSSEALVSPEILLARLTEELAELDKEEQSIDILIAEYEVKLVKIEQEEKKEGTISAQKAAEERAEERVQKINRQAEQVHKRIQKEAQKPKKEPREKPAQKKKEEIVPIKKQRAPKKKLSLKELVEHPGTIPTVATAILATGLAVSHEGAKHAKPGHPTPLVPIEHVVKKPEPKKKIEKATRFEDEIEKQLVEGVVRQMDTALYKELSYDGKITYLYRMLDENERKEHPGPYIVFEKETGVIYIIDENNKLIAKGIDKALKGMARGNKPNLVKDDFSNKKEAGNTPAGLFTLTQEGIDPKYKAQGSWLLKMPGVGIEQAVYIHPFLEKDLPAQKKAAQEGDLGQSAGCIRVEEDFLSLINQYIHEGSRIKVTAERERDGAEVWIDPETYEPKHLGDKSTYTQYLTKIKKNANI